MRLVFDYNNIKGILGTNFGDGEITVYRVNANTATIIFITVLHELTHCISIPFGYKYPYIEYKLNTLFSVLTEILFILTKKRRKRHFVEGLLETVYWFTPDCIFKFIVYINKLKRVIYLKIQYIIRER